MDVKIIRTSCLHCAKCRSWRDSLAFLDFSDWNISAVRGKASAPLGLCGVNACQAAVWHLCRAHRRAWMWPATCNRDTRGEEMWVTNRMTRRGNETGLNRIIVTFSVFCFCSDRQRWPTLPGSHAESLCFYLHFDWSDAASLPPVDAVWHWGSGCSHESRRRPLEVRGNTERGKGLENLLWGLQGRWQQMLRSQDPKNPTLFFFLFFSSDQFGFHFI